MDDNASIAERFAARGASSQFVARVKGLGVAGPPLPPAKNASTLQGRGVKFTDAPNAPPLSRLNSSMSDAAAFLERKTSAMSIAASEGGATTAGGGKKSLSRGVSKRTLDVEGVLARAAAEDLDLEALERLVEEETKESEGSEGEEPELWFDQNRKPLDAVQLAVKADINYIMGIEAERMRAKEQPIAKTTLKRLARPHAPEGTQERREIAWYHDRGQGAWATRKATELEAERQGRERSVDTTGRFLEEARARLPDFVEEKKKKEEEKRRAEEEARKKAEEDSRRANILAKGRTDEALQEYYEKRKRQLEKGKNIHAQRTGMFSLHNGGVRTLKLGGTDFRGSMSISSRAGSTLGGSTNFNLGS